MFAGTQAEYQSDAGSTKHTPYLTLTGEIWGVFCGYFFWGGGNWQRYNGTALYLARWISILRKSQYLYWAGAQKTLTCMSFDNRFPATPYITNPAWVFYNTCHTVNIPLSWWMLSLSCQTAIVVLTGNPGGSFRWIDIKLKGIFK